MALSRDSLDRERRGRIIGEDQHKGAIGARTRELFRLDTGRRGGGGHQAPGERPGGGAGSGGAGGGHQAPGAAPGAGGRSGGAGGGMARGAGGGRQAPGAAPGGAARLATAKGTSRETVLKVVSW